MVERRAVSWMPLVLALIGMGLFSGISDGLAVKSDVIVRASQRLPDHAPITQAAAMLQFRAVAVLVVVTSLAAILTVVTLLTRVLVPNQRAIRHHFVILGVVVILAVALNATALGGESLQLIHLLCPWKPVVGTAIRFCTSNDAVGRYAEGAHGLYALLNLRQWLNLPLAAAAACIGYGAFTIAAEGEGQGREAMIAIVIAIGGAMLTFVALLDRAYARWAFAGFRPTDAKRAFIDGLTFFSAATSSSLLAMIWLFAIGLLMWSRGAAADALFKPGSTFYGILAVVAPVILAIVQHLF